jgi:hypothetical protein
MLEEDRELLIRENLQGITVFKAMLENVPAEIMNKCRKGSLQSLGWKGLLERSSEAAGKGGGTNPSKIGREPI